MSLIISLFSKIRYALTFAFLEARFVLPLALLVVFLVWLLA